MENRHGLLSDIEVTGVLETTEPKAALRQLRHQAKRTGRAPVTVRLLRALLAKWTEPDPI